MKLNVVVSGQAVQVKVAATEPTSMLIQRALAKSGNVGGDWELRAIDGRLLEPTVKLRDCGIADGSTLFLSPRAGAGGNAA